jgi:hypothetical protein
MDAQILAFVKVLAEHCAGAIRENKRRVSFLASLTLRRSGLEVFLRWVLVPAEQASPLHFHLPENGKTEVIGSLTHRLTMTNL